MGAGGGVGGRCRIEEQIGKRGLAVVADHSDPFQLLLRDASSECIARLLNK